MLLSVYAASSSQHQQLKTRHAMCKAWNHHQLQLVVNDTTADNMLLCCCLVCTDQASDP